MWTRLVNFLCSFLVKSFPGRSRVLEVDGQPYLLRFYIKHNGFFPGIYLHRFYSSDPDRDLHNHPWSWSTSFILTGGYYEERFEERYGLSWRTTYFRPAPSINFIKGDTFHRIILRGSSPEYKVWTIFISGKEVKDWGFMTGKGFVPHKEYLGKELVTRIFKAV